MNGGAKIEVYRLALLRVVLALFEAAGMEPGGAIVERLPKPVRLLIARTLLAAETATRRLVLYRSRRLDLPNSKEKKTSSKKAARRAARRKSGVSAPAFWLFDKRKFFPELADPRRKVRKTAGPRILLWGDEWTARPAAPPKPVRHPDDAARMCRRMQALYRALQDIDAQALRLLRIMAKRKMAKPGPGRYGPMRSGLPPGYRQGGTDDIDELLTELHNMAWFDRPPPQDSS